MARSPGKRFTAAVLFTVAVLALLAFLFLLFADSRNIEEIPGVGDVPAVALGAVVLLGVLAIVFFVMILVRPWRRGSAEILTFSEPTHQGRVVAVAEETEEHHIHARPLRVGVVPHDLWRVPIGARAWGAKERDGRGPVYPFYYPRPASQAVYANDYIPIDDRGTRLKLRTLLAAPAGAFRGAAEERPAPARPRAPVAKTGSDDFMERLERRYKEAQEGGTEAVLVEKPRGAPADVYYDYPGDVHDVIDVEGIGEVYAAALQKQGVHTTARLCYEDAASLARRVDVPQKTLEQWQAMAELMKVTGIGKQYAEALARAGISGIAELKRRSAQVVADQVNEYLDSIDQNVLGQPITATRVESWKQAAGGMRRVRMQVPER